MESKKIKFNVKQAADTNVEVDIDSNSTVKDLKEYLATKIDALATDMKLIFKGKILKDHEQLDGCKVEEGITMHLVKSETHLGFDSSKAKQSSANSRTRKSVATTRSG